jgi:hypothetical protein
MFEKRRGSLGYLPLAALLELRPMTQSAIRRQDRSSVTVARNSFSMTRPHLGLTKGLTRATGARRAIVKGSRSVTSASPVVTSGVVWVTRRLAALPRCRSFLVDASVIVVKALDNERGRLVRQLDALARLTVALMAVTKVAASETGEAVRRTGV